MFDVLTLAALADEFAARLIGGRIQRVMQLGDAAFGIEIYAEHQRLMLVASADTQNPRLYLSSARISADPDRVTPLLLLLRKYARGGEIVAVQQPPLERLCRLSIAKRFWAHKRDDLEPDRDEADVDQDAEIVYTHLIIELMGRRSNIILVNDGDRILDAARRVTPEMSRVRSVLPGRQYVPPPPQSKQDPRYLTGATSEALLETASPETDVATTLVSQLAGFSPQMAREAVYRAFGRGGVSVADTPSNAGLRLAEGVASVLAPLESGAWQPSVYTSDDQAVAFAADRLEHLRYLSEERFASMSAAVERYLSLVGTAAPVRQAQRRDRLVAEIHQLHERVAARLRSLEEERERMEAGDRWRAMGELIYACLHQIEPGQRELNVEGMTIPLAPTLTPSENAQAYFERYRKAQSATANLPELIHSTRTELAYLEQLETLARFAEGIEEIEQLRFEWEAFGRQRRGAAPTKGKRHAEPRRPRPFRTERGDLVYVGRNGPQNDLVTFELAGPDDTWLHARGLPGAHVIIHWAGPPADDTIERAARLAAYFSGGRDSTTVPVDITQRRYVRKIKGAGPGMVTYRNERTINVRPAAPAELERRSSNGLECL